MDVTSYWKPGFKPVVYLLLSLALIAGSLINTIPVQAQAVRIIFLHHSCGHNLIEQGDVRQGLASLGYEFYDHGYNDDGLRLADGSYSGMNFDVPGDNTDPDGFAEIFAQPLHDPPDNTFSYLMQYDVIIFKSCYPTSNIASAEQLADYQEYYRLIRSRMDQHPEKTFIIVTQPPEVPGNSDLDAASRARDFVNWLQSGEYLDGYANIFVFDFFGLLADDDNFLRREYRLDDYDGHPNQRANQEIGPVFVDFIDQVIQSYEPGEPLESSEQIAVPEQPEEPTERAAQPPVESAPSALAGTIDDFEIRGEPWEVNMDDLGSSMSCEIVSAASHAGSASLQIQYSLVDGGYAGCGRAFETAQDWSSSTAVRLWLFTETVGETVTFGLFSGDPTDPTPFEVRLTMAEADWSPFDLPWQDFEKAEWFGSGGLAELDPSRITGYGFSFDSAERIENTVWLDDIQLGDSGSEPSVEATLPDSGAGNEQDDEVGEPVEAPATEEVQGETGGGICPFSMLVLPLAAVLVFLTRKKK